MPLKARDLKPGDKLVRDNGARRGTRYNPPPPQIIEEISFIEVNDDNVTVTFIPGGTAGWNGVNLPVTEILKADYLFDVWNRNDQ